MSLIVLDRDGVINYDSEDYIKSPEEWIPIPGSLEAIAAFNRAGYKVVIVTNQSGVGRGYYTEEVLKQVHDKLVRLLMEKGGRVEKIYYCPHIDSDQCTCRKPKSGMLKQVAKDYDVSFSDMICIGDSLRDYQTAQSVGCPFVLVLTGHGKYATTQIKDDKIIIAKNLAQVADYFSSLSKKGSI